MPERYDIVKRVETNKKQNEKVKESGWKNIQTMLPRPREKHVKRKTEQVSWNLWQNGCMGVRRSKHGHNSFDRATAVLTEGEMTLCLSVANLRLTGIIVYLKQWARLIYHNGSLGGCVKFSTRKAIAYRIEYLNVIVEDSKSKNLAVRMWNKVGGQESSRFCYPLDTHVSLFSYIVHAT